MSEPIWSEFLTERDKAVFAASGYVRGVGLGSGRRSGELGILRRPSRAEPRIDQALAQFVR